MIIRFPHLVMSASLVLGSFVCFAQKAPRNGDPKLTEYWDPAVRIVTPGKTNADPPSDAIILFNGKDLSKWKSEKDGSEAKWKIEGDALVVAGGTGGILTREAFGDCQLHIEWRTPAKVAGESQGRGNSGVYLHGRYEIQILDSYQNPTYANGSCGAVYGQAAPLVNASRPPAEWQTYDIVFHGPQCDAGGNLVKHGTVTLLHNGVLVQDHVEIKNTLKGCVADKIGEPGPLMLQDHNYKGAPVTLMQFRNIWFRPLSE